MTVRNSPWCTQAQKYQFGHLDLWSMWLGVGLRMDTQKSSCVWSMCSKYAQRSRDLAI